MSGWRRLVGWLYRERCLGCGTWGPTPVCEPCEGRWPALPEPACRACAAPALEGPVCRLCRAAPAAFSAAIAACAYAGVARRVLQALKYRHRRDLAPYLAARLAAHAGFPRGDWLLVPVPLHPRRERERGYNQAALLARALSKATGLPWAEALVRRAATAPQHGLSREQRAANLEGAFRGGPGVKGRRVLLVDDVLTTGATAHHASLALFEAGAAEVRVAVVARTLPPGHGGG